MRSVGAVAAGFLAIFVSSTLIGSDDGPVVGFLPCDMRIRTMRCICCWRSLLICARAVPTSTEPSAGPSASSLALFRQR